MAEEKKKGGFGKLLLISVAVLVLIIIIVVLAGLLKIGTEMLFFTFLVWAKCFHLTLKPLEILKVWTGAAVGLLIWLGNYFAAQAFGEPTGTIVLLVLIFIQVVFDVGHLSDWIVNPATAFILTLSIALGHTRAMETIVWDFCGGFLIAGLIPMIIGAILQSRKKSA